MESTSGPVFATLRGERVHLVELGEEHLEAVHRWRSDPEVTRYWIIQSVPTMEELNSWLRRNRESGSLTFAVIDEHGSLIGYTDVFDIDLEHRRCEIALMIGERRSWGRGYAREALSILLGHLFARPDDGGLGMHKVTLAVFAENLAARRVYQACGFQEDGVLRHDMYRDGAWHDQILMSILEDEFRSVSCRSRK
jgi:RimJ/RimL family protein N-acetyltransferase